MSLCMEKKEYKWISLHLKTKRSWTMFHEFFGLHHIKCLEEPFRKETET